MRKFVSLLAFCCLFFGGPAWAENKASFSGEDVIFIDSCDMLSLSGRCVADFPLLSQGQSHKRSDAWREIQLIVISPGDFTRGRSDSEVADQVLSLVAAANSYFAPLRLAIKLSGLQIFRQNADDPYFEASVQKSAFQMLEIARLQWADRIAPEHDAVAVLSKGVYGKTQGLAYTASSCIEPRFSFVFATQGGTGTQAELGLSVTLAHEMGHVIGMGHDDTIYPDGPSLMHSTVITNPSGFSPKSVQQHLVHGASGGAECFSNISSPEDEGSLPEDDGEDEYQPSVVVFPENEPPVISAPGLVESGTGEPAKFLLLASDPEGEELSIEFLGLPSGSLISYTAEGAAVSISASQALGEEVLITAVVSDGENVTRKEIEVILSKEASSGVIWPGSAKTQGETLSARGSSWLYNSHTGEWNLYNCDGEILSRQQFGGFFGDLPLRFKRSSEQVPAIYRVIGAQGYWFLEKNGEAEVIPWGLSRDIPVPGDYDGDGTTDLGVFRLQDNSWYIRFSSMPEQVLRNVRPGVLSGSVYHPFSGDVDGDGLDDRVLYTRTKDGGALFDVRFANGSRYGFVPAKAGLSDVFVPVSDDFDGDGRSDFAVRSSKGELISFLSKSGVSKTELLSSAGQCLLSLAGNVNDVNLELAAYRRSVSLGRVTFGDTDGDGSTNLSLWRENSQAGKSQWFERLKYLSSGPYPAISALFVLPTAGDFYGRKKSELTLFSDGSWVTQLESGETLFTQWGVLGDVPVSEDYNGDGQTDFAVFRPADSTWWIWFRTESVSEARVLRWGQIEDIPVPADYDGDGSADIAVYRPSTGEWFIVFADGSVSVERFGVLGDTPMPGDYTGDGKADISLFRSQTGEWLIKAGETNEVIIRQWGLAGDKPLKGDFDGDGRADLSVWRPSTGMWFIKRLDSLAPRTSSIQFGLSTDLPLGMTYGQQLF